MDDTKIAGQIILIPRMFNTIRDVSIYDLLKETGYFQMYEKVSEKNIFDELVRHPECIDEWMLYSEDKRSSSGYFIKQGVGNSYVVAYFTLTGKGGNEKQYKERNEACAAFIKHEIEEIRKGYIPKKKK